MDYENDIYIDEHDLKSEWLEIAGLIGEYGEASSDAKKVMLKAEEKVKTVRSELVLNCNRNPDLMGNGVKPTGPNIEAYYRSHQLHQKAKTEFIDAQHEYDVLNGSVFAFQAKKLALENLVKLFGMAYYAEPDESPKKTKKLKKRNTK